MIDCAPQVMSFTIYLHKDFIEVPFPITGLHAPALRFLIWLAN
jgi:hypothetical protein